MSILWIIAGLAAAYLVCICPGLGRRDASHLMGYDYAHRGLHRADVPENSLGAFRAAVEGGYGIELDVRLTRDNVLVIHHDNAMKRLCGVDAKVKESTLEEVRRCRLRGTEERIPTFDEVLALVDGRVPLIVELKAEGDAAQLSRAVWERMQRYGGPWCMESFDPRCVYWFRKHAPQVIRGQLTFGMNEDRRKSKNRWMYRLLASHIANCLTRPDFIAHEHQTDTKANWPLRLLRLMKPMMVAWTVKTQSDMTQLRKRYDLLIFEQFIPQRSDAA
ncbi:MAG: glycerophosphodiester phosphodiesterase [Clostridia bacterium]|nr:glycerophosphodiester phosphodiesterase [Clostridia bacterium]